MSSYAPQFRRPPVKPPSATGAHHVPHERLSAGNLPKIGESIASPKIQTKLQIGDADDPLEKEADRVAEEVIINSEGTATMQTDIAETTRPALASRQLQRASAECKDVKDLIQRACSEKPEDEVLQRTGSPFQRGNPSPIASPELSAQIEAHRNCGRPLSPTTRAFFEARMGYDFSGIRIHYDQAATSLSRQLGARAFTLGRNIFFKNDEYQPGSRRGRSLLAHELTHTVQQGAVGAPSSTSRRVHPGSLQRAPDPSGVEQASDGPAFERRRAMTTEPGHSHDFRAAILLQEIYYEPNALPLFEETRKSLSEADWKQVMRIVSEQIELSDVNRLLGYRDGRIVLRILLRDAQSPSSQRTDRRYDVRRRKDFDDYIISGALLDVGALTLEQARKIAAENFDDTQVNGRLVFACMKKVNFNVGVAFEGERDPFDPSDRPILSVMKSKSAELSGGAAPRNSHNMEALVKMGRAVWVGHLEWVRENCIPAVTFSQSKFNSKDDDVKSDPFTIDAAIVKFRPKSPEEMLLDSTKGAKKGVYMFVGSPEGHHSITLLLVKRTDGPVAVGSTDYTILWNDQYTDDGSFGIGEPVTNQDIAFKLFHLTERERRDPLEAASGMKPYSNDLLDAGLVGRKARAQVERQRCTNLSGMRIWRIMAWPDD